MSDTTMTLTFGQTLVAKVCRQIKDDEDSDTHQDPAADALAYRPEEFPHVQLETATRVRIEGPNGANNALIGSVLPSVLKCRHLVELDIVRCKMSEFTATLQFSELWQLKKLTIAHAGLTSLHPSIGALTRLQELDLSHNSLSCLPHTLQYCSNLEVLDVRHNSFTSLPGVLLRLTKLHTLWRSENRLMSGINQYQGGTRLTPIGTKAKTVNDKHNPNSLQVFCTKQLTTVGVHPWRYPSIAYGLRSVMAEQQTSLHVCDHCGTARKDTEHGVWVTTLMYRFVENTYIPFNHYACSAQCAEKIQDKVQELSKKSENEMDKQYITECAAAALAESSQESSQGNRTKSRTNQGKRRRRLRICAIM